MFLWRFYEFDPTEKRTRRNGQVDWKMFLLLKRSKDSWMDVLPMSAMSEEIRQNQYLADVAQEC